MDSTIRGVLWSLGDPGGLGGVILGGPDDRGGLMWIW